MRVLEKKQASTSYIDVIKDIYMKYEECEDNWKGVDPFPIIIGLHQR